MKTVIEMAREANAFSYVKDADSTPHLWAFSPTELERLVELVRADERSSWPAEMEAMERQVNILTDALAQEREACAKMVDKLEWADNKGVASAIRARRQV